MLDQEEKFKLFFFSLSLANIYQGCRYLWSQMYLSSDYQTIKLDTIKMCWSASTFFFFELPSVDCITKLIIKSKSSTCAFNDLSTVLVQSFIHSISPITAIIHSSLSTATLPLSLKLVSITPILKNTGMNPNDLNNYRLISQKNLERTLGTQLELHLQSNYLFEHFQSDCRSKHRTQTALVKITNDILLAADSGLVLG